MDITFRDNLPLHSRTELIALVQKHGMSAVADRVVIGVTTRGHYVTKSGAVYKECLLARFYFQHTLLGCLVAALVDGHLLTISN